MYRRTCFLFTVFLLLFTRSPFASAETAEGVVRSASEKQITLESKKGVDGYITFLISSDTEIENVSSAKNILPGFYAAVDYYSDASLNMARSIRVTPVKKRQRDYKIEKMYLTTVSGVIDYVEIEAPAFMKIVDQDGKPFMISLDPIDTQIYKEGKKAGFQDLARGQGVEVNCVEQEDGLLGAVSVKIISS